MSYTKEQKEELSDMFRERLRLLLLVQNSKTIEDKAHNLIEVVRHDTELFKKVVQGGLQ